MPTFHACAALALAGAQSVGSIVTLKPILAVEVARQRYELHLPLLRLVLRWRGTTLRRCVCIMNVS